jgi:hypothetical protein
LYTFCGVGNYRLKKSEKRVIFEHERGMQNASLKLHGLHFSSSIISVTISMTMRWTRHVAGVTEKRKHTKSWMEKT